MNDLLWLKAASELFCVDLPTNYQEIILAKARLWNRELIYQITGDRDMPWQTRGWAPRVRPDNG